MSIHPRLCVTACAALVLAALLAAGCATPERRIRQNQALFDTFPPNVQTNVRAGTIEIGYTPPMVMMALGKPDRIYNRTTGDSRTTVWAYTTYRRHHRYEPFLMPDAYVDGKGRVRYLHRSSWVDVGWDEEYDILRLEFNDEGVSAIESLQP